MASQRRRGNDEDVADLTSAGELESRRPDGHFTASTARRPRASIRGAGPILLKGAACSGRAVAVAVVARRLANLRIGVVEHRREPAQLEAADTTVGLGACFGARDLALALQQLARFAARDLAACPAAFDAGFLLRLAGVDRGCGRGREVLRRGGH